MDQKRVLYTQKDSPGVQWCESSLKVQEILKCLFFSPVHGIGSTRTKVRSHRDLLQPLVLHLCVKGLPGHRDNDPKHTSKLWQKLLEHQDWWRSFQFHALSSTVSWPQTCWTFMWTLGPNISYSRKISTDLWNLCQVKAICFYLFVTKSW